MATEEELVQQARGGDRAALAELIAGMKNLVYNLAIRMLGNPADAEDATQEILIRLVTNLASFRGESAFRTWVYRVASNQLLQARTRRNETWLQSFEELATHLDENLAEGMPDLDDAILANEAKLFCTTGMLLCLDRDHRLAFVLGEILELEGPEAAAVLEIEPAAFRQRLARARSRMSEFMSQHCGLINAGCRCRCSKQAAVAKQRGGLDPERLTWASLPTQSARRTAPVREVDEITRAVEVFRSQPSYLAPDSVVAGLKDLIDRADGGLLG